MPLNPHQEEVASHFEGRALVIAGPGSGKTSTITARIGRLLARGVEPTRILCITFTNKAADEMRERICKQYTVGKKIHISTFHALCMQLLRMYGGLIGYTPRMTILDSDDQEDLMAQIARTKYANEAEIEFTKPKIRKLLFITNDYRENLFPPSKLEEMVDDEEITEHDLVVIREYMRRLHAGNCVDFSGLLSETVRLLKTKQEDVPEEERLLTKLHNRYRFIQVDEYQDTNTAQNEIVELLAGQKDNVLAVGDQDQSIYEWRGANPEGIQKFVNRGRAKGSCKVYKLAVNYRSTPEIIAVADKLIRYSPNRITIDFEAASPSIDRPPRLDTFNTPEDEARGVAEKVKALINIRNIKPSEIAVFYRLNDMSRPIEQALARVQVPYKVFGGQSFYDRLEIRDCVAMLRVLNNPNDAPAFARIVNKPKRGIGEKAIGAIENFAQEHKIDLVAACARGEEIFGGKAVGDAVGELHHVYGFNQMGMTVADCLAEVVKRNGYMKHLESNEKEDRVKIDERKRNVDELVNSIALWCQDRPESGIADYLGYITLLTSLDDKRNDNAVRLMSLHASKGLEFDVVFMVGVENGLLPHKKAVVDRPEAGLNEERRLCYVGFTRARKQLFVSFCQQRQEGFLRGKALKFFPTRPSQFLLESGLMNEMEYLRKAPKSMVS